MTYRVSTSSKETAMISEFFLPYLAEASLRQDLRLRPSAASSAAFAAASRRSQMAQSR